MLPAGVLVLAAAIIAAVEFWPFSAGPPRPAAQSAAARAAAARARTLAARAGGRIVAVTPASLLSLASPDGTHVTRDNRLGPVGALVSASLDGRYLSLINGQVITVRRGPVLAPDSTNLQLSSENGAAWPEPFADHERALVMLLDYGSPGQSVQNPISVVPLATGLPVALGTGDWVAGDPQAAGALVAVAAPVQAAAAPNAAQSDAQLVLRDVGRPAVVLATASALNRDLGRPASQQDTLAAFPSPSGAEVAVTVEPSVQSAAGANTGTANTGAANTGAANASAANTGARNTGIVVLDRSGHVLGSVATALYSDPVWSPSGRALAYTAGGRQGLALNVWVPGRPAQTSKFPAAGNYADCVWSPDGGSILCAAGRTWVIARASGGPMAVVRGPGQPLAWLASAGRQ